jgi:putative colanic acid biosynthesis acetyltransferase WcaB
MDRFSSAIAMQRIAHKLRCKSFLLSLPATVAYKAFSIFCLSIDIPVSTKIGKNLKIYHGFGLVIHPNAVIGDNVILRHSTTIGAVDSEPDSPAPILGDGVDVGAGALILGKVNIGSKAVIGAGAIVTKDVPPGAICRAARSENYQR